MNDLAHDAPVRGQWQGMSQILVFNWRFYLAGVAVLVFGLAGLNMIALNAYAQIMVVGILVMTGFWMTASLAASHWVYDRSPICKWAWIMDCLPRSPQNWVNIHAGLDESSAVLEKLFPDATKTILDIFDPQEMTEASIAEARKAHATELAVIHADPCDLPLNDEACDALFLLFSAHEIRHTEVRLRFFSELKRVLDASGRIVIAEHLRDWKNFVVYGPGCFHFQSRRTWLTAAAKTGFVIEKEFGITPFVRIFVLRKEEI